MTTRARLIAAVGLSMGLHAAFVPLFCLSPTRLTHTPDHPSGAGLSVRIEGWERPVPARAPAVVKHIDYLPIEVSGRVGTAPLISSIGEGEGSNRLAPSAPGKPGGMLATPGIVRSVVYLIDRSGSMALSGGLDRALAEVRAALKDLPPDASFQVLFYNQGVEPLLHPRANGLLIADPDTIERAISRLDDFPAGGSTNHESALRTALYLRSEVLFLVTDADDLTERQVRSITGLNNGRTRIHVADLSRSRATNHPLADLARHNGGTIRKISTLP